MGKSYWAHVLADPSARAYVATKFPELAALDVISGFNASERTHPITPNLNTFNDAFLKLNDTESLWRTILLRAAKDRGVDVPWPVHKGTFAEEAVWVRDHGEFVDEIITELDDLYTRQNKKLVFVFDALDRLGTDWPTRRAMTVALLKRALAARSYRSIRLKLFMRRDQYGDPQLLRFPDGAKIANQQVELLWSSVELYMLLFSWLASEAVSASAFAELETACRVSAKSASVETQRILIDAIAGEFMGVDARRGRVYTWLPTHLSDARGETAPCTFLAAWREAALFTPPPLGRAVDYRGVYAGVRKASEDRFEELEEDSWWISMALQPLRNQSVPIDRSALKQLWQEANTTDAILARSTDQLPPVRLDSTRSGGDREDALIEDLVAIGVVEVRAQRQDQHPRHLPPRSGYQAQGWRAGAKARSTRVACTGRRGSATRSVHRFAHHPLCGRYAGEVIRVGRRLDCVAAARLRSRAG